MGMTMAGIPSGTNISQMIPAKNLNTLPSLESELTKILDGFEKDFPDYQLIILIDDLDKSDNVDDFVSVLDDINPTLAKNVSIIVASAENIVGSDEIAPLQRFDDDTIREFVKRNIPTIEEKNMTQIIEKSGGYPLALHWLWENYRRKVDINSILLRLPREGFLHQLQANFLDYLDDDEVRIMKICAELDIMDSQMLSKVSGLEQLRVNEILDFLELSSILIQINYQELADKQTVEIYMLDETFRSLIQSSFGNDVETNKKIIQYYVDSLHANLYPIRNMTIGGVLTQLERIGNMNNPKLAPQNALFNLDMDVMTKFGLTT